jgi:predicted Zn-dependent peptidase
MSTVGLTCLENGVRVVTEHVASGSVALSIHVLAGARDDPPGQAGISHLLEHMIFRGSERYSPVAAASLIDRLGDDLALSTTQEQTELVWQLSVSELERSMALLADMVLRPTFGGLEIEREVVLVEMEDAKADSSAAIENLGGRAIYGPHPLARRVTGTRGQVQRLSVNDLRHHHTRHYVGGAIVVAAAGEIHHREFVSLVKRHFGAASARRAPRRPSQRPRSAVAAKAYYRSTNSDRYSLAFAAPGIPFRSPLYLPIELTLDCLCRLKSSLLWEELRERRGLVYDLQGWSLPFSDAGEIVITTTTSPQEAIHVRRVVRRTLTKVQQDGLGKRLALARQSRLALNALDGATERAGVIGQQVVYGVKPESTADSRRRIAAVSEREVARALKLFAPERFSVIGLRPQG